MHIDANLAQELERLKTDTELLKSVPEDYDTNIDIIGIALRYMIKYSLLLKAIQALELEKTHIMEKV